MDEPETTTVVAGDASATVAEAAKKPRPAVHQRDLVRSIDGPPALLRGSSS